MQHCDSLGINLTPPEIRMDFKIVINQAVGHTLRSVWSLAKYKAAVFITRKAVSFTCLPKSYDIPKDSFMTILRIREMMMGCQSTSTCCVLVSTDQLSTEIFSLSKRGSTHLTLKGIDQNKSQRGRIPEYGTQTYR